MINIILNGYNGTMGTFIADLVEENEDLSIVAGIDIKKTEKPFPTFLSLKECDVDADVLIDFSHPDSLQPLVTEAVSRKLPLVIATTGLSEMQIKILQDASSEIPIFRTANMSLGINLIQKLLKSAVKILGNKFDTEIIEKHHNLKKDSPSGTAFMLADSINSVRENKLNYVFGRNGTDCQRKPNELGIHAVRGGTIVGEHEVIFTGTDEVISIAHSAYSKRIFSVGAVASARYIINCKPGMYNMHNLINQTSAVTTLCSYNDEALICINNISNNMRLIAQIYEEFAKSDIFIDMISHSGTSSVSISFTVKQKDIDNAKKILDQLKDLPGNFDYTTYVNITKFAIEGPGMEYQSGIASRLFNCLAKEEIYIHTVTTSESMISCIIDTHNSAKASGIIKKEFGI